MEPPVLDYATTPQTRRPVANWNRVTPVKLCVMASLGPVAWLGVLIADAIPASWFTGTVSLAAAIVVPCALIAFVFSFAFWPAVMLVHLTRLGGAARFFDALTPRSAAYLLVLLMLNLAMFPADAAEWELRMTFWATVTLAEWLALLWLVVGITKHGLRTWGFVVAVMMLSAGLSVRVHRCPHATIWGWGGVALKVTGTPCGNPRHFRPWWWQDR